MSRIAGRSSTGRPIASSASQIGGVPREMELGHEPLDEREVRCLLAALARKRPPSVSYDASVASVQRAIGRPVEGFNLTVALCIWHRVTEVLRPREGCPDEWDLRPLDEIGDDVARYIRVREAYWNAMRVAGRLGAQGNLRPSFFAKRCRFPGLAPLVWRMWWALADRPTQPASCCNIPPEEIEALLTTCHPMWLARKRWRGAVRLIRRIGMDRARSILIRPGRIKDLLSALRAWRMFPALPKRVATRVGRMGGRSTGRRQACLGTVQSVVRDDPRDTKTARFWAEFCARML